MLINLSNHPADGWNRAQKDAAEREFGKIVDVLFPDIDPALATDAVRNTARRAAQRCAEILASSGDRSNAVHCMGEFVFTYQTVKALQEMGIRCVASTTRRRGEWPLFEFVRFRDFY